jgi:hypothetical protein
MLKFNNNTIYQTLGRQPVHPFPARMAPGIALQVMAELKEPICVLDPMAGSGTVLAVGQHYGHHTIGFDIDPLAVLVSKVWTSRLDPDEILECANGALDCAKKDCRALSLADAYPEGADDETRRFISYWFDPYVRRQLSALASIIGQMECGVVRDALWCAFSRMIIRKQSGVSLARDVSHSRPRRVFKTAPEKPFNKFLSDVNRVVANGIKNEADRYFGEANIRIGDARKLPLPNHSVDLVLTSPPYLNAIDYIRCSKFSLVWMGYSIAELRRLRSESVGAEVGSKSALDEFEVREVINALKLRPRLPRRQERILARYVADMHTAIREVSRVLSVSGNAIYVVGENTLRGTYIRTSQIVSKLAEFSGLRLKKRTSRALPANRRYMPPPTSSPQVGTMHARMRGEVVLTFER